MGGEHSYELYNGLSFYLPLSFIFLGIVTMILIPTIVLRCCYEYGRDAENTIYSLQFQILCLVYSSSLKRVETDDGIVFYTLYDRRLAGLKMVSLFVTLVLVYFCSMMAFFSELFVTESTGVCNIHMDCFAFNTSTGTLVRQEALQGNCSDIQDDSSYLIQCYKISLNYVTAIGSAGGVLVFGYFIMTYQTPFLKESVYSRNNNNLILYLFIFVSVLGFVVLILVSSVPELRASIYATRKTGLQFMVYTVTFQISLWASSISMGSLFKQELVKEAKKGDEPNVTRRMSV